MIVPVANTLISCLEVFSLGVAALAVLAALAASASFGGADSTFGSGAGTSDRGQATGCQRLCGSADLYEDYMRTIWGLRLVLRMAGSMLHSCPNSNPHLLRRLRLLWGRLLSTGLGCLLRSF